MQFGELPNQLGGNYLADRDLPTFEIESVAKTILDAKNEKRLKQAKRVVEIRALVAEL
jgi:hypothetical protein